jgi:endonuclease YncB( thermonuclease family)
MAARSRKNKESGSAATGRTQSSSKALATQLGKVIALVLVLALVLLIQRYCTVQPEPFGPEAKIVSIDGDTLRAGNGAEYRIFAIDAPELKQTCEEANGKEWLCGRAAKVKLTKLINGGEVTCEVKDTDRFGRNVALCSAAGVPDIGEALVRDGYAIDLGGKTGYAYADVEAEAREAKRGIWRGSFQRPSEWRQDNPRTD